MNGFDVFIVYFINKQIKFEYYGKFIFMVYIFNKFI